MKEYVARRKGELKAEIALLDRKPGLTVVQVGHDAGSDSYIRGKRKDAEELGFLFRHLWFDEAVEELMYLGLTPEELAGRIRGKEGRHED